MAEQNRLHPPAQTDFEAANSAMPDTDRQPAWDDEGWDQYLYAADTFYRVAWDQDHGEEPDPDDVDELRDRGEWVDDDDDWDDDPPDGDEDEIGREREARAQEALGYEG